jgi:predicted nucleic acid-binding protein
MQRGTSRDDPGLLDVMNLLSTAYLARDNYVNTTPLLKELLYAGERKYGTYSENANELIKKVFAEYD